MMNENWESCFTVKIFVLVFPNIEVAIGGGF